MTDVSARELPRGRLLADGWIERDVWQVFGVRPDGHYCIAAYAFPDLAETFAESVRISPIDGHGLACDPYQEVIVKAVVNHTWPGYRISPKRVTR